MTFAIFGHHRLEKAEFESLGNTVILVAIDKVTVAMIALTDQVRPATCGGNGETALQYF